MHKVRCYAKVAFAASATILLASCSAGEPSAPAPSSFSVDPAGASESATPTASPSPTRNENDRGDLVKGIDEVASVFDESNPDAVHPIQFKVTDIKPAECTSEYAVTPDEGNHLIQLDLEVETTKEMRDLFEEWGASPVSLMFDTDWSAYASNGTTMNAIDTSAASSCLAEGDTIPFQIGPAEKAVGSVVFEVSDVQGEIAHRPWFMGDVGWTWAYDISTEG